MKRDKCLFIYYSYSGDIQALVPMFEERFLLDTLKLESKIPYPSVQKEFLERYNDEIDNRLTPECKVFNIDFSIYQTIFLGMPNWSNTLPPVIRTFLSKKLLKDKTIIPIISYDRKKDAGLPEEIKGYTDGNKVTKALLIESGYLTPLKLDVFIEEVLPS